MEGFKFEEKDCKKPLCYEDQIKYIKLAQEGDQQAKEMLIYHNLALVFKVLNYYYPNYSSSYYKEDLIAEGCIGLCKAIDEFDFSLEYKFSTYAIPKIRGEMGYFLRFNTPIHVPMSIQNTSREIKKVKKEYSLKYNIHDLTPTQIAKILNKSIEEVNLVLGSNQQIFSIYQPIDPNSQDELYIEDTISDSTFIIEQNIEQREFHDDIIKSINSLTEIEAAVIKLFFGIESKKYTIKEIIKVLNISEYRVLECKDSAISKLKTILPQYIREEYESCDIKPIHSMRKTKSSDDLFKLYPEYSKEQILNAINLLSDTSRKVMELRFGLNGHEATNVEEIAKLLNIKVARVNARITYSKNAIKDILIRMQNVSKEFLESFPGYSEPEILSVINSLDDINKNLIELKYGLNGKPVTSNPNIARILAKDPDYVMRKIKYIKKVIAEKLQKQRNKILKDALSNEVFKEYKDELKTLINMLDNHEEKIILLLRLGFIKNKNYSEEEIGTLLKLDKNEIHSIIMNALDNLRKLSASFNENIEKIEYKLKMV